MTASQIIDTFGGTTALAEALGAPTSTVHSWRQSNSIPAWRHAKLLDLAAAKGITLSTADFPDKQKAAA